MNSGESEIRTHVPFPKVVFETTALPSYATSPNIVSLYIPIMFWKTFLIHFIDSEKIHKSKNVPI